VTVRAEVAVLPEGGVIGVGRAKVTPEGAAPTQDGTSVTAELNPLSDVTVIVDPALDPCITVIAIAEEAIEKSGVAGTGFTTSVIGTG
jgi:hypothetical protein